MSEQQREQQNQNQNQENQEQAEAKKVELDEETYAALLDKLDELEKAVQPKGSRREEPEDDLDELAREGRQATGKDQGVNMDDMTPSQLAAHLNKNFTQSIGPVLVAVNELKYTMEMDKLMRPKEVGGEGCDDLLDYRQEIMELMMDNPKMSMKRAYTLAKAENPERSSATKKAKPEGERETRLRHLPPHPHKGSLGERPGSAEAAVRSGDPKSLQDAAERAFNEVMKTRE